MDLFPVLVENSIRTFRDSKKKITPPKKMWHIEKEARESNNKDICLFVFFHFLLCPLLQVSTVFIFTNFTMETF